MKKINALRLLSVLFVLPLFFVACQEPADELGAEGIIKPFTLAMDGTTAENLSVLVDYSKSKTSHPYVVGVVESDYYEAELEASGEEAVKGYILEQIAEKGASATKVDKKYVFSGSATVDLASAWELESYKSYYVAAFAVDASDKLLTNVEIVKSSAVAPLAQGNPYASLVSTSYKAIIVDVAANGFEGNYYVALSSKEQFERGYKGDANEFVESLMAYELDNDTDLSVVDNTYIFNGDAHVDLSDSWSCYGATDYYVLTFGIDAEGELTSEIHTLKVRSGDYITAPVELTVEYAGSKGITFSAVPGSSDEAFIVFPMLKDEFIDVESFNSNATNLAGSIIYFLLSNGIDPTAGKGGYSYRGVQESVTMDAEKFGITPSTEYVMVAFSVDEDYSLASAPVTKDATTPKIENTGEKLKSLVISDITYVDAVATVDVGDFTGNYYLAPFLQLELEEDFGGDKNAMLDFMINYEIAHGTDFDTVDGTWIFNGSMTFPLSDGGWNIEPGYEYVVYAFGVSSNGTITTEVMESEPFVTPGVNHARITMDVHDICDSGAVLDFSCTPGDVSYYRGYAEKSLVEGMSDGALIEYLKFRDGQWDFYYEALQMGDCTLDLVGELEPATEYIALSFIYFINTGIIGEMNKQEFTTTGEPAPEVIIPDEIIIPDTEFGTIDVSNIYVSGGTLTINPIDDEMNYLVLLSPATYFDRMESMEEVILDDLAGFEAAAKSEGHTLRRQLKEKLKHGDALRDLYLYAADKEYVAYVYGFDLDACQPLTKPVVCRFSNVGAPEYPELAPIAPAKSRNTFTVRHGEQAVQSAIRSSKLQRAEAAVQQQTSRVMLSSVVERFGQRR